MGTIVARDLALTEASEESRQFSERFKWARRAALGALRAMPSLLRLAKELNPKQLYTIEFPPEAAAALANGTGVWPKGADGLLDVAVRSTDGGKFIKHLRLREIGGPVDFSALGQLAIQSQLAGIVELLEQLRAQVDRVLEGQRTDREGQILAGTNMYQTALRSTQPEVRTNLLRQCLQPLEVGRSQSLVNLQKGTKAMRAPTGKARVWGEVPSRVLVRQFGEASEDLRAVFVATRTLVLVYEELDDRGAAGETLAQFATGIADSLEVCNRLSEYLPGREGLAQEKFWRRAAGETLPAARDATASLLSQPTKALRFEFAPGELVEEAVG